MSICLFVAALIVSGSSSTDFTGGASDWMIMYVFKSRSSLRYSFSMAATTYFLRDFSTSTVFLKMAMPSLWLSLMVRAVICCVLSRIFRDPGCAGRSYSSLKKWYSSDVRTKLRWPCSPPPRSEESDRAFVLSCFLRFFNDSYDGSPWNLSGTGKLKYTVV